jgi:hypothetical protein
LADDLREIISRVVWKRHKAGLDLPMDAYLLATALVSVPEIEDRPHREKVLNEALRFLCRHGLTLENELTT